ncbi:hypothetical protein GCM10010522_00670 [Kribbella solani]
MLSRLRLPWISLAALAALVATSGAAIAYSEPPPGPPPSPGLEWVCGYRSCQWIAKSYVTPGAPPSTPGTPGKHAKQTKAVCTFRGAPQQCTDAQLGNWSNQHQCYMRREVPSPPPGDVRWQGHTNGSIWACVREQGYDGGRHLVTEWVWLPGRPDTVITDPETLAYEAIAKMHLLPPLVRSAPGIGEVGLVNMPVWLWVAKTENTWGPIERVASVPGLSVTAKARVVAVDWSLGDGQTVRCEGAGTAYTVAMGVRDSPDCGHRYKKTSRALADCKYPVTATARWKVSWESTLGEAGQLDLTQVAAAQLRIGEAVPVLVDPDGGDRVTPTEQVEC